MINDDLDSKEVESVIKVIIEHISRVMSQVSLNSKEELRETLIPLFSYSILEKYTNSNSFFRYCFFLILDELSDKDNWVLFALIEIYPIIGIDLIEFESGIKNVLDDMTDSKWYKSICEDLAIIQDEINKYPDTFNRIQTTELKGRFRTHG